MKPTRQLLWLSCALAAAASSFLLPITTEAQVVLAIILFAMVLWISEILPLAITALASSLLLIVVAERSATVVFSAYFDPVIVLLMGGFFLGVALSKHGLDATLASYILRRVGSRPSTILLAVMGTTAVFSMWISNTASTAIMLPMALGVVTANPSAPSHFARNMVLGVAFSANIGGIATPIGTTANPIALRFLAEHGESVTFFGWMARAVPLAVLMILVVWLILLKVYPMSGERLTIPHVAHHMTNEQKRVVAVFSLTVLLWLTTDLHGYSASLVAVVPMVLLFVFRVLQEADISKIGWPTLLLIGGGLAIGDAAESSGLTEVFSSQLARLNVGGWFAFATVAAAAVVMTLMASNTAAAVIMIPIVIQLATGWSTSVTALTMLAAVGLSLDFMVPVGTPPNAMAHGTGHVNVRQMAKAGVWISLAGVALSATIGWMFW